MIDYKATTYNTWKREHPSPFDETLLKRLIIIIIIIGTGQYLYYYFSSPSLYYWLAVQMSPPGH